MLTIKITISFAVGCMDVTLLGNRPILITSKGTRYANAEKYLFSRLSHRTAVYVVTMSTESVVRQGT